MDVFCMLLVIGVKSVIAFERKILIYVEQDDGKLEGLGCAIDDPLNTSGGKFNLITKACTKLSRNWFLSPSYEANNKYFRLIELENLSLKNITLNEAVPTIAIPGGSIFLYIKSSNSPQTGSMWTDFKDSDDKTAFLQKIESNEWCFDAAIGSKDCVSNAITQPNRNYELKYSFSSASLEVYLDGILEYSFAHRLSITKYQRLRLVYSSPQVQGVFTCSRIVYKY